MNEYLVNTMIANCWFDSAYRRGIPNPAMTQRQRDVCSARAQFYDEAAFNWLKQFSPTIQEMYRSEYHAQFARRWDMLAVTYDKILSDFKAAWLSGSFRLPEGIN